MKAWITPFLFGVFMMFVGHFVTIAAIPSGIMSVALNRIAEAAGGSNRLFHGSMVTPQNQTIVRSSPDLAYSTCALDLSKGPVRVYIGKGRDYASAAFYAANTDNVFTLNDNKIGPQGAYLLIVSSRSPISARPNERVISLPSEKGLLLVRRLAPSAPDFARVEQERAKDSCQAVE
jgi:uncharacterized membrane protein